MNQMSLLPSNGKRCYLALSISLLSVALTSNNPANKDNAAPHWSYLGADGSTSLGEIAAEYTHCNSGRRYDAEVHLAHQNASGSLAVVDVFLREGRQNPLFQTIPDHIAEADTNTLVRANILVDAENFLPGNRRYFFYSGSLTTPPCGENVNWTVMQQTLKIASSQLEEFTQLVGNNARPLQNLHWRSMLVSN